MYVIKSFHDSRISLIMTQPNDDIRDFLIRIIEAN